MISDEEYIKQLYTAVAATNAITDPLGIPRPLFIYPIDWLRVRYFTCMTTDNFPPASSQCVASLRKKGDNQVVLKRTCLPDCSPFPTVSASLFRIRSCLLGGRLKASIWHLRPFNWMFSSQAWNLPPLVFQVPVSTELWQGNEQGSLSKTSLSGSVSSRRGLQGILPLQWGVLRLLILYLNI